MRKIIVIVVFVTVLLITVWTHLNAKTRCIYNSLQKNKSPDYKSYHYVNCDCNCDRYPKAARRNKCISCGHFHKPEAFIIQKTLQNNPKQQSFISFSTNPTSK